MVKSFLARQLTKVFSGVETISVFGDVGKTTTALACEQVISERFNVLVSQGGVDNLPVSLLKLRPKTQKLILDADPKTNLEAINYLKLIKPKIVIMTSLDYLDQADPEAKELVFAPRLKVVNSLDNRSGLILNWHDPLIQQFASNSPSQIFFYGFDAKHCHVWAENIHFKDYQTTFELNYGVERVEIKTPLLGYHQISSLLAAATVGLYFDIPLTSIKRGLVRFEGLEHHTQPLVGFNGSVLIDDTLSSTLIAFDAALETIQNLAAKRKIVVLEDMKGFKGFSDKYYRQVGQKIYNSKLDMVIIGQGEVNMVATELLSLGFEKNRILSNLSNPQIVSQLLQILSRGDLVLFKGSRISKIDEVIKRVMLNR